MPRQRDPNRLTPYLCWLCKGEIVWGDVLRVLRTDPGQPDFEMRENYAHRSCMRGAMQGWVPLDFARFWDGTMPMPDDNAQIDRKPCGLCNEAIAPENLTRLRIQVPVGQVKAPAFNEESVPVHQQCFVSKY